jgi:hypothetical protein
LGTVRQHSGPNTGKDEISNPRDTAVVNGRPRTTSEAEYFAQYAEVQPALDSDDPSKQYEEFGKSSLNGDVITIATSKQISIDNATIPAPSESPPQLGDFESHISHPRHRHHLMALLQWHGSSIQLPP